LAGIASACQKGYVPGFGRLQMILEISYYYEKEIWVYNVWGG
jgi:hypothetical protein